MRRSIYFILTLMALSIWPIYYSAAQSGVLIPSSLKAQPDAQILSLSVMNVDILIDNQHARIKVLQIFDNHVANILEGKYLFALPTRGSISDFAIWENNVRIPGVIMEKRRAEAVYGSLMNNRIDPGLLQQDDERGGSSAFSVKVFPIPSYGSKRIELEYTEMLPVEELTSHFTFPLKPSDGYVQQVDNLNIHIKIINNSNLVKPELTAKSYPMQIIEATDHLFEANYQSKNVKLNEDLALNYHLNIDSSKLYGLAYRAPERITAYDLRDPALAQNQPDGYFQAMALFNEKATTKTGQGNNLIFVVDTSLSMYGERLGQAVEALETWLYKLQPQDHFNLILFNEHVDLLTDNYLPATPANIEKALTFFKSSMLYGGTDLQSALVKALELVQKSSQAGNSIVLISDANPTAGELVNRQIVEAFQRINKANSYQTRLFALGLGNDTDKTLLEELVKQCDGYTVQVRETESLGLPLQRLMDKINKPHISDPKFTSDSKNFYQVYDIDNSNVFDGGSVTYVGRYRQPAQLATLKVEAALGSRLVELTSDISLPEFDDTHNYLPRLWARARVDALLREMNLNGEREDYIAEIIRLAQKYKFVTPYTSFIAAPRALLRPRLIQPGDPVIRVKTDPSIQQVFAVLPFGETLPLKYLADEGVWEGRFFAPTNLPDGTYQCRLLMTDKHGQGYQEEKSLVIDSHAPKLQVQLASQSVHAGDTLTIRAAADKDTVRLVAKLNGIAPVTLHWSPQAQTNIGTLQIPQDLAAGHYNLTVIAEDPAYNQASQTLTLTILPKY